MHLYKLTASCQIGGKNTFGFFKSVVTYNFHTCYLQEREAVPVEVANSEPGCQYYEQLCYNNMWLKVGDCVYIRSHGLIRPRIGRQANYNIFPLTFRCHECPCYKISFVFVVMSRIEKMWEQDGVAFFFGPIFIHPEETEHEPTKMFYQREVFLSNVEETSPMMCIIGTSLPSAV